MWGIEKTSPLDHALLHRAYPSHYAVYTRVSGILARRTREGGGSAIFMDSALPSPLPQAIVAALLVTDLYKRSSGKSQAGGDILVITREIGRFRDSLERFKIGPDGDTLEQFWDVRPLSKHQRPGLRPAVYLANPGWRVDHPFADVVVDATDPRVLASLPDLRLGNYIAVTPVLDEATLARLGKPALLWDADFKTWAATALGKVEHHRPPPPKRHVQVIEDPALDEVLWAAYRQLSEAQRLFGHFPPLWGAWAVFHQLRMLAAPLYRLETHLQQMGRATIRQWLVGLRHEEPAKPEQRTLWNRVADHLSMAYEALFGRDLPPKFVALVEGLEQAMAEGRPCWAVAATKTEAHLLQGLIPSVSPVAVLGGGGQGEVIWCNEEERRCAQEPGPARVLLGYRNASQRYLDLGPYEVQSLAYPFEADLEQHLAVKRLRWLESLGAQRQEFFRNVSLDPGSNPIPAVVPRLVSTRRVGVVREIRVIVEESPRLDLLALSEYQVRPRGGSGRALPSLEVEVHLEGGQALLLPMTRRMTLYHPLGGRIEKEARHLIPGDRVVILVDGVYDDLFERLTEAFRPLTDRSEQLCLALWDQAKWALRARFAEVSELQAELARLGLGRHYATVRGWVTEGGTLAPQSFGDFVQLAMNTRLLKSEQLPQVWSAVEAQRGRHRQAGRVLSRVLEAIATGGGYEEALRDARTLGFRFEELMGAVDIREVVSIQ